MTIKIFYAGLLAGAIAGACLVTAIGSTKSFAAECNNSISQYGQGRLEMPPEKYWTLPIGSYIELSCDTITLLTGEKSNADCHLRGGTIIRETDGSLIMGMKKGDIYICTGQSGALKEMLLLHEIAHRHGWQHNSAGSRLYTVKQWRNK